jgi:macrolide transport system ATP-binding/permease protein
MTQITATGLSISFGIQTILDHISFTIEDGDRIGLVGSNGTGKSTLLALIEGSMLPDQGVIWRKSGSTFSVLRQAPLDSSVKEEMIGEGITASVKRYMRLLNLDEDIFSRIDHLSGGDKTKLALAVLLSHESTVLLLDEPTNNLDYEGITALIEVIRNYRGTVVIVSHDRYFLDQTVDRIMELENHHLTPFPGNYSEYKRQKKAFFEESVHRYEVGKKEQNRIKEEIEGVRVWSEKAHRESRKKDRSGNKMGMKEFKRAKAKKMDQKVKNDTHRLERLIETGEKRPYEQRAVRFEISSSGNRGRRILEAEDLSMSFGDHTLFANSHFYLQRGEKCALFGRNGCGKSTLLSMILETLPPTSGSLWVSSSSTPSFLPQTFSGFPPGEITLRHLMDTVGKLDGNDRALLSNIGITKEMLERKIGTLSFGEQMKLKLIEPILMKKDFIIMDEPTNHLDIGMREKLEETLTQYDGTLLIASHDIFLLRGVCNKVLLFENGVIRRLEDSFEEYWEKFESGGRD